MTPEEFLPSLAAHLHRRGLSDGGHPQVKVLSGGQSNPTFLVQTRAHSMVLRKQPSGAILAGAHAVDREFRVMSALADSGVPVPKMLDYCEDASVIGTPFFLMEFLKGRVMVDQSLPGLDVQERRAIYQEMNRVIAALHAVNFNAIGLADYGKTGNYFARQISRWTRQLQGSTVPVPFALQQLMEWLPEHMPDGDETTLVHGDFRLDNMVFHETQPQVIGLLDWELSTLGHPLADFAYQCMSWRIPPDIWRGIGGLNLQVLGIPEEAEYVQWYAQATGRQTNQHWEFYMAYNLFRMAAILHGIAQRAHDGTASAHDAAVTGARAGPVAEIGWICAQRYQQQTR